MQMYIHLLILHCKILVGSTQTLELHPGDAGCFKQIKRKTVLFLAEFSIQPLCQCRHNSLVLAGVLKQGREGVLRFEIAVLCGGVKGFGEDALGKDLRVGAARQLCQLRVGQQTVMQGSKQHPVGIGELALELLIDLQNDLVQRLLGVVAESTFLGDRLVDAFGVFQLDGTGKGLLQLVILQLQFALQIQRRDLVRRQQLEQVGAEYVLLVQLFICLLYTSRCV